VNKFKVVFYGPGWVPNVPGLPRTGDPSEIPEVEKLIVKHDPKISSFTKAYIIVQFLLNLLISLRVSQEKK